MNKPRVFTNTITINKFYNTYYKDNNLIFNTEYQRSEVWNSKKKQKLIDSILKEYNLGMIFLRKINNGNLEVLDGQQRLKAIFQYIENEYPTSPEWTPEIGEKFYDELKEDGDKHIQFMAFNINVAFVENADEETTSDIFLRLQEGMPLNTAEKLNAMRGKMHKTIIDLSKHPFINNSGVSDHRFNHRVVTAQIFILELESKFDEISFPDANYKSLKEMYEKYSFKNPPSYVLSRTKKYMNFLNKAFGDELQVIKNKGDIISVYLLYSYLDKKYVTQGIEDVFVDFTLKFLSKVESTKMQDTSINLEVIPYRDYKSLRSTGALSSTSFRERFKIILGKFLETVPDIELKDPKRDFDYGQKIAVYYRDKGICKICNSEVSFDDSEIDHVVPWNKGGSTTVTNGQLACKECNRRKGSR